ncbi:erythromycin esterase family protein [Streptomyces sp. NPDC021749]|uniref:erythromycin esterase family protein n=1 Tax=Streptomyces sp. NPDC021749 TaxID=3154905 RepID=UPI0034052086
MVRHRKRISRRGLLVTAVIATGAVLAPVAIQAVQAAPADTAGGKQNPVRALEQAAHPLRSTEPGRSTADLRPLGAMTGDAKVVGLGEATHGSHEFFTMKERVFRCLVEEKGFTTFALELNPDDPGTLPSFQRFRDEVMAQNVTWWQQHTGHKVLLSAHNDHVGRVAGDSELYPKTQGSFLRDTMGENYVPIGFTFHQGSFLSKDAALVGDWKKFTVDGAEPGRNEYTLDQVRYRDFSLDVRNGPAPARAWLNVARPTLGVGTQFPVKPRGVALVKSFDVLIHLHDVRAAHKRMP